MKKTKQVTNKKETKKVTNDLLDQEIVALSNFYELVNADIKQKISCLECDLIASGEDEDECYHEWTDVYGDPLTEYTREHKQVFLHALNGAKEIDEKFSELWKLMHDIVRKLGYDYVWQVKQKYNKS